MASTQGNQQSSSSSQGQTGQIPITASASASLAAELGDKLSFGVTQDIKTGATFNFNSKAQTPTASSTLAQFLGLAALGFGGFWLWKRVK